RLAAGDRAHAPAAERLRREERLAHPPRAVRARDAAPEDVAGIRRAHAARPLVAVEREGIGAQVLAPEVLLEARAKLARRLLERARPLRLPEHPGEARRVDAREIHVALHLAERDG